MDTIYSLEPCEECGSFFQHECWTDDSGRGFCPHCGMLSTFDHTVEED